MNATKMDLAISAAREASQEANWAAQDRLQGNVDEWVGRWVWNEARQRSYLVWPDQVLAIWPHPNRTNLHALRAKA